MFGFLGELEEFAADLYPYRWPITVAAVLVALAAIVLVVRMGWHRVLWEHRVLSAAVAAPLLVAAMFVGNYTLSPLWERSRLDEASPLAAAQPTAGSTAAPDPTADSSDSSGEPTPMADPATAPSGDASFMARVTHRGMVEGADDFHFGRGDALLIETAPGVYTLRFENFSVRNGPDLFIYLTNDPNDVSEGVNLGDLKATDGNFNYDIPEDIDPTAFRYAIVWCRNFEVLFATAPLEAV